MKNISFLFLFVFLFGVSVTPAFAASSGARSAGTGANDATVGTQAWTTPTKIDANDGTHALATEITSNLISQYLKATNFGFSIPDGAQIDGIIANVERIQCSDRGAMVDSTVKLVKSGSISGDNKADTVTQWSTADKQYGGSTDLWGNTWTAADINSTNFGIAISGSWTYSEVPLTGCAQGFTDVAAPWYGIDYITITVHYTEAAAATSSGGGGNATWLIQLRQQNGLNAQGNPLSSSSSSSTSSVSIEVPVETVTATDTTEGTASSASSSSSSVSTAQAVEWHWFSDTDQTPEPWVESFRLRVCDRIEGWFKTKPSSVLASVLPRLNDRLKSRWGFGCRAPTSEGI
ncbi:MAG: hypothetical protein KBC47_03310 [Candidatus Peribacteraceae bacterium]|nr:hypothetical protein [Candidatus Peribacteraceae bacterium]